MGNPAKTILLIILLLLIILVFFALTGINLRQPEQAAYTLVDKVIELNRAINRAMRQFFYSIRLKVRDTFNR
jgi:hypothetical protein